MKCRLVAVLVFFGAGLASYPLEAQSLGDVARQSEERRKDVKKPAKVYTNKDLGPVPGSAPGTLSAMGPASETPKETAKAGTGAGVAASASASEKDSKRDQGYWSGRKKDLQKKLDTDQTLAAALESRINSLNTDFVNRDDPVQRAGIDRERKKAVGELERLKQDIQADKKALADLDEEARRAGIPAGWLR